MQFNTYLFVRLGTVWHKRLWNMIKYDVKNWHKISHIRHTHTHTSATNLWAKTGRATTIKPQQDGQCTRRICILLCFFVMLYFLFFWVWNMSQVFNACRMHSLCRWREASRVGGSERGGVWERDDRMEWTRATSTHVCHYRVPFGFFYIYDKCIALTKLTHAHSLSQSLWSHAYVCVYKCHDTVDEERRIYVIKRKLYFQPKWWPVSASTHSQKWVS